VDWVTGPGRPPLAGYLYDGGVLTASELAGISLQAEELNSWRLVAEDGLGGFLTPGAARRVRAGLAALLAGTGPAELVDGRPAR
jgi:hypothetical protein